MNNKDFKKTSDILEGQLSVDQYLATTYMQRCDSCGLVSSKLTELPQLDSEEYQDRVYCDRCLTQIDRVGVEL